MDTNLDSFTLQAPPEWSLQLGSVGKFTVLLAVVLYLTALVGWLIAPRVPQFARFSTRIFQVANFTLIATFLCLASLFITNRFEYAYVWEHSDLRTAVAYRFAGLWSGQQGSFLLWATCAAIFGIFTVKKVRHYERWYVIAYSGFLAMLSAILAFESPFNLNMSEGKPFVPADGFGLAPSLQNYWVVIHPPTIFLGFGSLTVLFALAFSALAIKDYESWVPILRPIAILSLTLTGLGLCMGGFWAYETLGWGGFWMWDPVENVSFVPWCFGIALTHGLYVQAAKKKWKFTNLLLAGAPFLAFVYGTFLTRSGFLSDASVHSFAEMNSSALKLLIGAMAITFVSFLGLLFTRIWQARREEVEATEGFVRDRWVSYGMWSLCLMGLATFVGMSVPFLMALNHQKSRVVEEGLYHQVMAYFFIPIVLLMGVTPFISWKKSDPKKFWTKVYGVTCVSIGISALLLFGAIVTKYNQFIDLAPKITLFFKYQVNGLIFIMVLVVFCIFALVASVWQAADKLKGSKLGLGAFLGHAGVAVLMLGLIVSRGFEAKESGFLMKDHPTTLFGNQLVYKGMTINDRDRDNKLIIEVQGKDKKPLFTAKPGLYKMTMGDGQESTMVWPHIERGILHDTYLSLGQPQNQGTQTVSLKKGEKVSFGKLVLTNLGETRQGENGMAGTTFGAKIQVTGGKTTKIIEPKMELQGSGGPKEIPAAMDDNLNLVMAGMNAADKSVSLRVDFVEPMYPVEIFHKPFTSLVFAGTFIMTVAGIMSALYRRAPKLALEAAADSTEASGKSTSRKGLISTGISQ